MWKRFFTKAQPVAVPVQPEALSLRREVEALALPEGRHPFTEGHRAARSYLMKRMAEIGLAPYRGDGFYLPYEAEGRRFHNIVGEIPGSGPPVLIAAHYDSVIEAACADDNAAGVAIALDLAERLVKEPASSGVVFAFFDAEEPPWFLTSAMGSIRFHADQMRPEGVRAALVMDLVGHEVPLSPFETAVFVTGAESHPAFAAHVEASRIGPELKVIAAQNRLVGDLSDYHIFRENGYPYLFLTCGHWAHYHQPSDTPDRLDYVKMNRIRAFLLGVVRRIADAPPARSGEDADTTAFEIRLLEEAAGAALPALLKTVGVKSLKTRGDMDRVAYMLQTRFGL